MSRQFKIICRCQVQRWFIGVLCEDSSAPEAPRQFSSSVIEPWLGYRHPDICRVSKEFSSCYIGGVLMARNRSSASGSPDVIPGVSSSVRDFFLLFLFRFIIIFPRRRAGNKQLLSAWFFSRSDVSFISDQQIIGYQIARNKRECKRVHRH